MNWNILLGLIVILALNCDAAYYQFSRNITFDQYCPDLKYNLSKIY